MRSSVAASCSPTPELGSTVTRQNNPAELNAFEATCDTLAGFDHRLDFEWVDGYFTAMAATFTMPALETWLPVMAGDAFERAFADPPSATQALRVLKARLSVLRDELDPEWLADDPDGVCLNPLMVRWDEDDRAKVTAEHEISTDLLATMHTGLVWSEGFLTAVEDFPSLWATPPQDRPQTALYLLCLLQVQVLGWAPDGEQMQTYLREFYPGQTPSRDELVSAACLGVQNLRLWWVDHAPVPATRRVDKLPGRNGLCHCGSGRKFKKCHGAETS